MNRLLMILMIMTFSLTACGPEMDTPVNSHEPSNPQPGDYIPGPADSSLVRDQVYLDSVDLLTMESYPLQFALVLKGSLATPCHKLRVAASLPDAENKIVLDIYSVTDPHTACIQILEPFEVNFPLGSYPTGHYSLWANGEQITEFDA